MDVFYSHAPWIVMEKLATGDFQRRSLALAAPPQSMLGDLDQDGISDLVAFYSAEGTFEMLEYADVTPAGLPFYDGFEDRNLGNSWENRLSDDGEVLLQSDTLITGTQTLHFAEPEAELILYLDLAGEDQVDLSFLLANEGEPYGEDGVYISADGQDWSLVAGRTITTTMDILQYEIDLDEAADLNGLVFNDSFESSSTWVSIRAATGWMRPKSPRPEHPCRARWGISSYRWSCGSKGIRKFKYCCTLAIMQVGAKRIFDPLSDLQLSAFQFCSR